MFWAITFRLQYFDAVRRCVEEETMDEKVGVEHQPLDQTDAEHPVHIAPAIAHHSTGLKKERKNI